MAANSMDIWANGFPFAGNDPGFTTNSMDYWTNGFPAQFTMPPLANTQNSNFFIFFAE